MFVTGNFSVILIGLLSIRYVIGARKDSAVGKG